MKSSRRNLTNVLTYKHQLYSPHHTTTHHIPPPHTTLHYTTQPHTTLHHHTPHYTTHHTTQPHTTPLYTTTLHHHTPHPTTSTGDGEQRPLSDPPGDILSMSAIYVVTGSKGITVRDGKEASSQEILILHPGE